MNYSKCGRVLLETPAIGIFFGSVKRIYQGYSQLFTSTSVNKYKPNQWIASDIFFEPLIYISIYIYRVHCGKGSTRKFTSSQSNLDKHVISSIYWAGISSCGHMLIIFCTQECFLKLKPSHNPLHISIYWYISRAQILFCKPEDSGGYPKWFTGLVYMKIACAVNEWTNLYFLSMRRNILQIKWNICT